MADNLRLTRFNKFFGGITVADRSRAEGVSLTMEELDPFQSRDYIIPQTIFTPNVTITDEVAGFTLDESDNIYTIVSSATNTTEIFKRASASQTSPSTPASLFVSGNAFYGQSPVKWHKWASGADYLYYVTGTNALRRLGDLPTVTETSVGTLSGLTGTFNRIPMIRTNGELYIGNGQYIANVDDTGTFLGTFASIYSGWQCVSFARSSNLLAILARSPVMGENKCKVFFWDFSLNPDSMIDEIDIPMGGPQIIENHNETLRVICAKNGIMKAYAIDGRRAILTHTLYNVATETESHAIVPDTTKFVKDNIMYFGLWKTDKTGLYALGQVDDQAPVALILAKRFGTSNYALHRPHAAIAAGQNFYGAYLDDATDKVVNCFDGSSPSRSSQALYESIWYDASNPEISKQWEGFILTTTPVASAVSIGVVGRVDNATNYASDVTSITRASTTATVTTTTSHGLITGDSVVISGALQSDYNGTYTITVTAATTFTYTVANSPTTPATGVISAIKSLYVLTSSNDQIDSGGTANTNWIRTFISLVGRTLQFKLLFISNTTAYAKLYQISLVHRDGVMENL
jgi:hypothetical protein